MPRCPKSRVSHFNPRSPHGERRTGTTSTKHTASIFQSTLPARGATSDRWQMYHNCQAFQSTLPARGATPPKHGSTRIPGISIHAPRTGSDRDWKRGAENPERISIHAPRTGSDDERGGIAGEVDFNPRSPHGERHTFRCWLLRLGIFQSTLPARGATRAAQHQQKCNLISIHAPRTGSDCSGKSAHLPCCDFNPRSPHGERRTRFICSLPTQTISIHAPRTGSDQSQQPVELRLSYFNPRSPHGERPTRCDTLTSASYFNPRSPHGERLA